MWTDPSWRRSGKNDDPKVPCLMMIVMMVLAHMCFKEPCLIMMMVMMI